MAAATGTGMTTGDWVGAAQSAVQAAAILIGSAWAYWKFVRGRTFHRRAEVSVEASLVVAKPPRVVRAKLIMRNTGASDIPLRAKVVRVFAFAPGEADSETGVPDWVMVAVTGAFRDHEWVESQETITDDVLVELDPAKDRVDALALRATCIALGKRKRRIMKRKRSTAWTSHAAIVVDQQTDSTEADTKGVASMPDKEREYQRGVDEDEAKKIEQEETRQREVSEEEAQRIEKESEQK